MKIEVSYEEIIEYLIQKGVEVPERAEVCISDYDDCQRISVEWFDFYEELEAGQRVDTKHGVGMVCEPVRPYGFYLRLLDSLKCLWIPFDKEWRP